MAEKRKVSVLTLDVKKQILAEVDKGRKKIDICKEFNIPKSTLSTYIKNRAKINEINTCEPARKRHRSIKNEDMEKALFMWFQQARAMNIPLSGPIICAKADEISKTMGIENFTSNSGWLDRFKKRHSIIYKTASVSRDSLNTWKEGELKRALHQYEPCNIFNADETGLFFRCLPHKIHALKGENCSGGKIPRNRLTVLVAANMDGSEKLPLLVIGKFPKPRCFRNCQHLPLQYYANKKAWMTSSIYESWIHKLDSGFKSQGRKVAMIVDNCPAHPQIDQLEAIEIIKLPPNTIHVSALQPCDQGIIAALKQHYRENIIQKLIIHIDEGKDIKEFDISILDAMYDLRTAWNCVTPFTVQNCFAHCGFKAPADASFNIDAPTAPSSSQTSDFENLFDRLRDLLPESQGLNIAEYFTVDDQVITTSMLTMEEIISSVVEPELQEEEEEDAEGNPEAPTPPTAREAREALSTLRSFLETQGNDQFTDTFGALSLYLNRVSVQSSRQFLND